MSHYYALEKPWVYTIIVYRHTCGILTRPFRVAAPLDGWQLRSRTALVQVFRADLGR